MLQQPGGTHQIPGLGLLPLPFHSDINFQILNPDLPERRLLRNDGQGKTPHKSESQFMGLLALQFLHKEFSTTMKGFPGGSDVKESACNAGRPRFDPWVGKIPWR